MERTAYEFKKTNRYRSICVRYGRTMEENKLAEANCVEERRTATYDWKIDNFLADLKSGSRMCSFTFQIYGYDCWLDAKSSNNGSCAFSLYKRVKWNTKLFPVSYTFDIIDRNGMSFLKINGEIQDANEEILMVIAEFFFFGMKERLIQRDILTVHFSWFEKNCSERLAESEEGPLKFLKTLSNDFGLFYESKTDTDCLLKVGETQFPVHRAVLSARSNVFSAMFHHDTLERQKGEVVIQGIEASALGEAIYYMYTSEIRGLTPDTAVSMYIASDKYALIEMRDVCLTYLMDNLTSDNVCDAAVVAHSHGETALESKVVQFIKDRLEYLVDNDSWKLFSKTNPNLAYKFTANALLASKSIVYQEKEKTIAPTENTVSDDLFSDHYEYMKNSFLASYTRQNKL